MTNRFFTPKKLQTLISVQNWKIICSSIPSEIEPVEDSVHLNWMKTHTDSHSHREIMIALQGRMNLGFAGKVYPVVPGTVILMDSFEEHDSYYPELSEDISHLWFYITHDGIRFHEARSIDGILALTYLSACWLLWLLLHWLTQMDNHKRK